MFTTIVAGVTVFVFGQFILKLILDPVVSFKESLGCISAFFLRNRAAITNVNATIDMQNELRDLISILLSKKEAIPQYNYISKALFLPPEDALIKACQSLNLVGYEMVKETSQDNGSLKGSINILMELRNVSELLEIRLDYSEL